MNNCPACQSENADGVIECRKCGLQFLEMTACSVCQTENVKETIFCKGCGTMTAFAREKARRIELAQLLQDRDNPTPKSDRDGEEIANAGRAERSWNYGANDINNTYAWALAIVPLVFAFITNRITDEISIMGLVIMLLTIVFWLLDKAEIKKAGYKSSGWMYMLLIMTPLYLFLRAKKTGKQYGYAICWCIVFVCNFLITFAFEMSSVAG